MSDIIMSHDEPEYICPSCDSPDHMKRMWTDHSFPYRDKDGTELGTVKWISAYIPVTYFTCCDDGWIDWCGEIIKEEALQIELGLPTDREMEWLLYCRGIENVTLETTGMSRDEFLVRVVKDNSK